MTSQNSGSVRDTLAARFRARYGASPVLISRAPGRVNLIGEHTDYNDGFVMPAAIEFCTWVAAGPRNDGVLQVVSEQFADGVTLPLAELTGLPRKHWSDYVRGVAALLLSAGSPFRGANLMIDGQIPFGAGLSSSAALEVATALALGRLTGVELATIDLVRLCQRAEHEYAGTHCGIMDQYVSAFAQAGHALRLDCRSLEHAMLPLPEDVRLVAVNTEVQRELVSGEYNSRRDDCEAGVVALQSCLRGIRALRDLTPEMLECNKEVLPEKVYRRCRHVVTENQRVIDAGAALCHGQLERFGELMYASHRSLRDDFEVSCEELDLLVSLAEKIDGVYGARMTGGGFGGCTVNLVRSDAVERFCASVQEGYRRVTGRVPPVYVCTASQGAEVFGSEKQIPHCAR